ncbi:hypothetical protein XM38_011600 [Halomicronema hongdechloris C2206]|uniref:VOC domain-containing protein n=1 Tax=Halomicronema hongdechloris C2206 TaxID=1641165 RepID=A0A1Z3HIV8_9CYAN|nr:VOC family protein [Halomicronema hongdechloris]ASC70225.1 hypothetical protein XM38_011600 [Halomicronema hongdechloris C2206]
MTQILHPLHIAVLVSDIARSRQFYSDLLNLPEAERALSFPGIWYQVGSFQIHLILHQGWQAPRATTTKWGRNPHMAFAVSDLDAIKQRLLTHHHPVQMSASGRAALFTQDPDGNIIELSQLSENLA